MAEVAKIHSDKLSDLKETIEKAREYFQDNVDRYEKFVKFVFKTSLSQEEVTALAATGRPSIEFNILEALLSRLRGEFAKQQPALSVRAADGVPITMLNEQFAQTLDVMEAHMRAVFFDGQNDMLDYNVFSDLLAGGFSVLRVFTKYVHEKSFEQNIMCERTFDPTLTYFDPLARESHKGDGRFCGELYPMTRKDFEDEFGKEAAEEMTFTRNLSGFDWSFANEKEDIVLVAEHYEKKMRKETILKLSNEHVVTKREYDKFLKEWEEAGIIEQPPAVVSERKTMLEHIVRYRICESKVLSYSETDFKHLPLVFVDGNSVMLKEAGSYAQMTRPWCYHGEGLQRLKNYAGQSLANELENTVQHKFIAAVEGIPVDYQDAYQNVQKSQVLLYKNFLDAKNPEITLPPPREVARTPIPPEISGTFRGADEMIQTILGSYDNAGSGVTSGQLSGIAFARSAIQSNNASVPYIVGFIKGLNRVAQIIVDLIPKYYKTPRSLPVLLPNGKRSFVEINKQGALYMNFDPNNLQVKVEIGVNFSISKEIALQSFVALSQANQGFAQFFNEEGLPVLLDNLDIRGIDQLKVKAEGWMQKQKQLQQQQMQMAQQQAQMQAKQQSLTLASMEKEVRAPSQTDVENLYIQQKAQNDAANVAIKARDSEIKFLETLAKIRNAQVDSELKKAELAAENERSAVDSALAIGEHINNTLRGRNDNNG